ncbi:S-adenosyl-L-methionine-dependent methyltransferase [Phanerochaete sordida]|uniref:S-adenosyl-L-methionine-dependent methyltransferase n=1 Tax=Phanerochaete sordida TaxID=48140 RepID=A0A9P3G1P9_9APHY|nr:S-adenosyl-L-methionine-dependent methyltransferase [Phanerochaete sordida]
MQGPYRSALQTGYVVVSLRSHVHRHKSRIDRFLAANIGNLGTYAAGRITITARTSARCLRIQWTYKLPDTNPSPLRPLLLAAQNTAWASERTGKHAILLCYHSMSNSSSQHSSLAELRALSRIIQESIDAIDACLTTNGQEFPSPDTTLTMESEAARMASDVDRQCSLIVSAAYQLICSVRSPMASLVSVATQYKVSAALRVALEANVVEALREAGPKGAHVSEIAKASCVDPGKLARILRLLATNHIFVEVAPDVFTNNRISTAMDTGKSIKALLESPTTKYVGTTGVAASVGHITDEGMKAAAYLAETLLDSNTAQSQEPTQTALNLAFRTDLPAWEWLESKGNEHRLARFAIAMDGSKNVAPPSAILEGFDWKGLKDGAIVVDVGGGLGSQALTIAWNCPHLHFVVQDREPVVKEAEKFWTDQFPAALQSGQVRLQVHDFFTPQPITDASVFLLRNIIHDWSDKYCLQILRHLRNAATPDTHLVIVDSLVSYACEDDDLKNIPGAVRPVPPKPLLPNMGHAATAAYQIDIQMLDSLNGKERTVKEMNTLMEQTGWRLVQVHQSTTFSTCKVIGVPS